jgi:hypothetical protein
MARVLRTSLMTWIAALALAVPAMAGTLDQQQTDTPTSVAQSSQNRSKGQSFTAGLTGQLDQVDLPLSLVDNVLCSDDSVRVSITTFDVAGLPTGTILAAVTVPMASIADDDTFKSFTFPSPAPVTAGTTYAILVEPLAEGDNGCITWPLSDSDPYPRGVALTRIGGLWEEFIGVDFVFKTYVAVPTVPPETPPGSETQPVDQITCAGRIATIVGTNDADELRGTSGDDVIAALRGDDSVQGRGGDDLVCGGKGRDDVAGGRGDDFLRGGSGRDTCDGGPGRDDAANSCQKVTRVP